MDLTIWIAAWFLFAVHLLAGGMKLLLPIRQIPPALAWAHQARPAMVRVVGAIAVLGALGVVLPDLTGIAQWLGIVAAFGLAAFQAGAIVVHFKMGPTAIRQTPVNAILLLLSLYVAIGRILS